MVALKQRMFIYHLERATPNSAVSSQHSELFCPMLNIKLAGYKLVCNS
ncbi:hypothetical protein [Nostoc sp.]